MLGKKTGGRKKGVGNKATVSVQDRLRELKCDPIEGMAKLAMDKDNTPELRGKMFSELSQYVYPKRKAIEHSGPAGGPIGLSVSASDEFTSRIISLASRLRAGHANQKPD